MDHMRKHEERLAEGVPVIETIANGKESVKWNLVAESSIDEDLLADLGLKLSVNGLSATCTKDGDRVLTYRCEYSGSLPHELYWVTSMRNLLLIEQEVGNLVSIENRPRKNWKLRFLVLDSVTTCDFDMTDLMVAAKNRNSKELEKMVKILSREEINTKTPAGKTALHYAIEAGHISNVEILLEGGADVNVPGEIIPLEYAAAKGLDMVEKLVAAGADLNFLNKYGESALMTAAAFGRIEAVSWLLAQGALGEIENVFGETALDKAIANKREEVARLFT